MIVVDDGSTDDTREILERYPEVRRSTSRTGLSVARNVGLQAATGRVVAYTDSDCLPTRLADAPGSALLQKATRPRWAART